MFLLMWHVAAASFLLMAWFVQSSIIRITNIWFHVPKPRKHVFKLCYRLQLRWPIDSCVVIEHCLCNTIIKLGPVSIQRLSAMYGMNSHYRDKTFMIPWYLCNWNPYIGKTACYLEIAPLSLNGTCPAAIAGATICSSRKSICYLTINDAVRCYMCE